MATWEQTWRLTIDTLGVLAWPGVALVALIVFRRPLSTLIDRMRGGEFMGAKFSADEAADAALAVADEFNEHADGSVVAEPQGNPIYRREQVERIVTAAATAGYRIGALHLFPTEVEPAISWASGVPEIHYWRSADGDTIEHPNELAADARKSKQLGEIARSLTMGNYASAGARLRAQEAIWRARGGRG